MLNFAKIIFKNIVESGMPDVLQLLLECWSYRRCCTSHGSIDLSLCVLLFYRCNELDGIHLLIDATRAFNIHMFYCIDLSL